MPSESSPTYPEIAACLPDLGTLMDKVVRVHGAGTPSLLDVQGGFVELRRALELLAKRQDEAAASMVAARSLRRLRLLSDGYCPPASACRSYRALFAGLAALDHASTPRLQALAQLDALPEALPEAWRPASHACRNRPA